MSGVNMRINVLVRTLFILVIGLILISMVWRRATDPLNGLHVGIHDKISDSAWIQYKENGLVQIQMVE